MAKTASTTEIGSKTVKSIEIGSKTVKKITDSSGNILFQYYPTLELVTAGKYDSTNFPETTYAWSTSGGGQGTIAYNSSGYLVLTGNTATTSRASMKTKATYNIGARYDEGYRYINIYGYGVCNRNNTNGVKILDSSGNVLYTKWFTPQTWETIEIPISSSWTEVYIQLYAFVSTSISYTITEYIADMYLTDS